MEINPSFISSPHVVWVDNPLKESKITRLIKALLRALAFPIAPLLPKHFSEKLQPKYHGAIQKSFPDIFSLIRKYGSFQNIQRRIEQGKPVIELLEAFEGKSVSEAILIPDPQERKALEQTETYLREFRQIVKRFEPGGMDHHTVRTNIYVKDQALFDNPKAIIEKFTAFQKNVITKPLCEWSEKEVEYFELHYFGKILIFEQEKKHPVSRDNLPPLYQAWIRSIQATPSFYKQRRMHQTLPLVHKAIRKMARDWKQLKESKGALDEHSSVKRLERQIIPDELFQLPRKTALWTRFSFLTQLIQTLSVSKCFRTIEQAPIESVRQIIEILKKKKHSPDEIIFLFENHELLSALQDIDQNKRRFPKDRLTLFSENLKEKLLLVDEALCEEKKFPKNLKLDGGKKWIEFAKRHKEALFPHNDRKEKTIDFHQQLSWDRLTSEELGKKISLELIAVYWNGAENPYADFPLDKIFTALLEGVNPFQRITSKIEQHLEGKFNEKLSLDELDMIERGEEMLSKPIQEKLHLWQRAFFKNSKKDFIHLCFVKNPIEDIYPDLEKGWQELLGGETKWYKTVLKTQVVCRPILFAAAYFSKRNFPYGHANFLHCNDGECKKIGIWDNGIYNDKISGNFYKKIEQYTLNLEEITPKDLKNNQAHCFQDAFNERLSEIFENHINYRVVYPDVHSSRFVSRFLKWNSFHTIDPEEAVLKEKDMWKEVICSQFIALALLDAAKSAYVAVGRKLESMEPLGFHKGENLEAMHPVKLRNKLLKKKIIQKVPDPRKKVLEELPK